MKLFQTITDPEIVELLASGAIGVLRTDTLYGLVANARNERAVERVYDLKNRNEKKSPIVLIANNQQLFDTPETWQIEQLNRLWPGKISIILKSTQAPIWIRRDNGSVAYRLPDDDSIRALLEKTGPLIAPSANPEGNLPAKTCQEAIDYFGDNVDFYVDGDEVEDNTPSQLIRLEVDGTTDRLR